MITVTSDTDPTMLFATVEDWRNWLETNTTAPLTGMQEWVSDSATLHEVNGMWDELIDVELPMILDDETWENGAKLAPHYVGGVTVEMGDKVTVAATGEPAFVRVIARCGAAFGHLTIHHPDWSEARVVLYDEVVPRDGLRSDDLPAALTCVADGRGGWVWSSKHGLSAAWTGAGA
jgi:hypothetical protein